VTHFNVFHFHHR